VRVVWCGVVWCGAVCPASLLVPVLFAALALGWTTSSSNECACVPAICSWCNVKPPGGAKAGRRQGMKGGFHHRISKTTPRLHRLHHLQVHHLPQGLRPLRLHHSFLRLPQLR
jgi:hypothetical protein